MNYLLLDKKKQAYQLIIGVPKEVSDIDILLASRDYICTLKMWEYQEEVQKFLREHSCRGLEHSDIYKMIRRFSSKYRMYGPDKRLTPNTTMAEASLWYDTWIPNVKKLRREYRRKHTK